MPWKDVEGIILVVTNAEYHCTFPFHESRETVLLLQYILGGRDMQGIRVKALGDRVVHLRHQGCLGVSTSIQLVLLCYCPPAIDHSLKQLESL